MRYSRIIREGGWLLLWGCIILYIVRRTYIYLIAIILGASITFGSLLYLILTIRGVSNNEKIYKHRRFRFTYPEEWISEGLTVNSSQTKSVIFEESPEISQILNTLIELIINEFINSWFLSISTNPLFQESVHEEITELFQTLQSKLSDIDYAKLLVINILPILNDHFTKFSKAEEAVKLKSNNIKTDSQDFHLAVAQNYDRGKVHHALTLSSPNASEISEKKYIRSKVSSILPELLSKREKSNEISVAFLTEILSCTVLTNVIKLLSDADFYNVLIVNLIGDNLKHRGQVKQLLAALEEHTKQLSNKASINFSKLQELEDSNKAYTITANMETGTYKELVKSISSIDSIDDIRLNVKLYDILNNRHLLKLFREFMSYRNRLEFLEFWLDVDSIKAPLEDSTIGENGESNLSLSLEFTSLKDLSEIYLKYNKVLLFGSNNADASKFEELTNSVSINSLESYSRSRKLLFKLQNQVYKEMEDNDFVKFKSSASFSKIGVEPDVDSDVIQAVENAFTEIMSKPQDSVNEFNYDRNKSSSSSSLIYTSDSEKLSSSSKRDIFGEASSLFGPDSMEVSHFRNSKLFDDTSDESDNDSDSLSVQNNSQILEKPLGVNEPSQVFVAAPGNLNLAEEIPKLTEEIEKMNEQVNILKPLLRKAELTNNTSELKILSRSMTSLEREINSKELQKQQYIVQESDNSLYAKSRVCIQSYISGNEGGKEFILYIIEVQKFDSDDPDIVKAGWVVARRYSQFYKLHDYLRSRYPQVGLIKFPKKSMVLKFQQRQLVELRKTALEEYLQELIKIPDVCSDKAFRSFLSSENFTIVKNTFDESVRSSKSKSNVELVANKLYNGISSRLTPGSSNITSTTKKSVNDEKQDSNNNKEEIMKNIIDMQQELKSFDEYGMAVSSTAIFVKPICDLLISVFRLSNSKSWLRGRALIVILQQIFGTTIEKKVYEQIDQNLKSQKSIINILVWAQTTLFPNGKFKDPPPIRTYYQQSSTRQEAKVLLGVFMNETCSKIFGTSNTTFATSKLFGMLQNDILNKHLLYEILDELFKELFPDPVIKPISHSTT
ncbi:intermediate filament protein [Scheffersomyces amazonensis]|uniref:intermediate filament protein n=1 Tax=Scheffersomyces amazonensis TaxID=1078765 RepID=UPI00315C8928